MYTSTLTMTPATQKSLSTSLEKSTFLQLNQGWRGQRALWVLRRDVTLAASTHSVHMFSNNGRDSELPAFINLFEADQTIHYQCGVNAGFTPVTWCIASSFPNAMQLDLQESTVRMQNILSFKLCPLFVLLFATLYTILCTQSHSLKFYTILISPYPIMSSDYFCIRKHTGSHNATGTFTRRQFDSVKRKRE